MTVDDAADTDSVVGQATATLAEQVAAPLSQLSAKVVGPEMGKGSDPEVEAVPDPPLVQEQDETPVELQLMVVDVASVGLGLAEIVHPLFKLTTAVPLAVTPWYTEVIVEVPTPTPVTRPEEEIVATPVLLDVQVGPVVVVAVVDPSAL